MNPIFGADAGLLLEKFEVPFSRLVTSNALRSYHQIEALVEATVGSFKEILIAIGKHCQIPPRGTQLRQRRLDIVENRLVVPFFRQDVCLFLAERKPDLIRGTRQG